MKHKPGFITYWILAAIIVWLLSSCCRPATEFQMAKWEKKHKFESPRAFWGLHISIGKKNVYKYR